MSKTSERESLSDMNQSMYSHKEEPKLKKSTETEEKLAPPMKKLEELKIQVIFDYSKRFFKEGFNFGVLDKRKRYVQKCMDSYPPDELQVSNSNLINQVLVKPNFLAILTYETGLSIYKLVEGGGQAQLLGRDASSLFMYIRVDISKDLKHVFSFKYNLDFEYSVFDKETNEFKVRQDIGALLTQGGQVNGVVDLKYCDDFRILAAVVKLNDSISLFTFKLKLTNGHERLMLIEKVPQSDFAREVKWALWGKYAVVGFDYEQNLGKKDNGPISEEKDRIPFLQNILSAGKRMSSTSPQFSIRVYKVHKFTKKMDISFNLPLVPGYGLMNIKMVRLSGDSKLMLSLSKTGVLSLWKKVKARKVDKTFSGFEHKMSEGSPKATGPQRAGLQYELIRAIEVESSPIELVDLSSSGKFISVVLKNGQVKTFTRKNTRGEVEFDLMARSYSEGSSVKHCYFTKDEKKLIYEVKSGVLKSEKIKDLQKRAEFVESGQVITYGDNWKIDWLEFMNGGEYLLAAVRDLRGSGEGYKTDFFERTDEGDYEKLFEIEGNAHKFSISGDGLLFCCVCFPGKFSKFVRKSNKQPFKKSRLDLEGREPYAVLVFPESKDLVVSTSSFEVLLYKYCGNKKNHKLENILRGDFKGFLIHFRKLKDSRDLAFSSFDRKIRLIREKTEGTLDYEVYQVMEFEDVASDFRFLDDNKMILVALNSGMIVTMLPHPKDKKKFFMSQSIKIFGKLGLWNDLRLQMFNNNKYFFIYHKGHHLFNPNAHTELNLFSINQKHVQKVDTYGLVEHFWTSSEFGVITICEKEDPSTIKIVDLKKDFQIPQMQDVYERYTAVVQAIGSVNRTKNLFSLHKTVLNYLTNETRTKILEQENKPEEGRSSSKKRQNQDALLKSIKIKDITRQFAQITANEYRPWNRFRDEAKLDNQFNLLHYGVLLMNIDFIKYMLKNHGYRPLYSPEGYDPFDWALVRNDIDVLNSFAEGLQDQRSMAYLLSRMDLKMFVKIMNSESAMLKRVVMRSCFVEPTPLKTHVPNSFPFMKNDESFLVFETLGMNFTWELRHSVDKEYRSRKGYPQWPIRGLIFRFLFNSSLGSKSAKQLLEAYKGMPADLKTGDYHRVIQYLWRKNFHFICLYSFFVIFTTGLFHAYITWLPDSLVLAIIILFNCALLLFYEGVNLVADPRSYFSSHYNFLDLYIYLARPAIVVLNLLGMLYEDKNELIKAWVNGTLTIAGIRTMGELRVFSSTRVLMAMISQVVYDMVAFTVITIGIIIVFSLVSANIHKFEPDASIDTLKSFGLLMTHYYNVAAGNWEESIENLNYSEVINFYISGIALFVLMINLLIAVISLTFDQFLETKEFCDLEQLHEVMMDHSYFIAVGQKVGSLLFGARRRQEVRFHHCFMIREEEGEDGSTQEDVQNLKMVVEVMKESNQINFRKLITMIEELMPENRGDDAGSDQESNQSGQKLR